jgi:hypothetical protein
MRKILIEEVEQFVVEMDKGKYPIPDGYTIEFFHASWSLLKQYVLDVVEDYEKLFKVLPPFNSTLLISIPKEENVKCPNKFRIISLCNVIF